MTNPTKEMIKLLADAAIEKMAEINGTSQDIVKLALEQGNNNACAQFQKLMQVGFSELNKMAA